MQPLEAARRALRLTRLEGLAASTAFLNIDDEAVAAKMQGDDTSAAYGIAYGALLLFLWCMSFYAQGGVRRASFVLYLVACGHVTGLLGRDQVELVCEVVVRMAWENRRALWGDVLWGHSDSWVMAAIACVVGYIVPKVKSEHPDAHEGHLDSFYGTYSIPSTRQHANSIWLLLHAALRSYTGPYTVHSFHYFAGTSCVRPRVRVRALAEAAGERHSLKGKVLLLQSGYHASAWENARGKVIDSLRRLSLLRGIATIWGCLCCVYSRCSACAVSYPVARFPT